jgi:uncharacterized membrane protein YoaK (UPF0700 family)
MAKIHKWVLAGAIFLSFSAGYINAIGVSHLTPITHVTGSVSQVAINLESGQIGHALHFAALIFTFFVGCVVSGFMVQDSVLKLGRRYGVVFLLEAISLFAAVPFLNRHYQAGYYITAFAFGLQNAMTTTYSGALVRTTHLTGLVNDFGIAVGHLLRGLPIDWRRFKLYGFILSGFLCGGVVGMMLFTRYGFYAYYLPALLMAIQAFAYTLLLQYIRISRSPQAKAQWQLWLRRHRLVYQLVRYCHRRFSHSMLVVELEKLASDALTSS